MSMDKKEKRQRYRFFPTCRICGREIRPLMKVLPTIVMHSLVFCPEHVREFKHRRRDRVGTSELDNVWGDTLKNWSERPSELDKEARPKFMATSFVLRNRDGAWLIFERSYYQFSWPHLSKSHRIIRNPKKDFWWRFKKKSVPRSHRLSDYIAINSQTGEIRRFIDVAVNEVIDDLRGVRPAPAQEELAPFWGKRRPDGIRERSYRRSHQLY